MSNKDHKYHLYRRVNIGNPIIRDGKVLGKKKFIVFRCMKPNCSHYVTPPLLEGKIAECSRCHEPFVCDKASKHLANPHCIDCAQKKKKDIMGSTLDFIKELENDR